ncbi:hypothetical protein Vadar_003054 [Vaccinium darrowii]|uniref:Uncharacterized protein n=1 Tax=Vaccinium darrowii TaxID=229202 RepID=A0ACB7ZI02_9ERIC|nr:hypothetical protein Vadar_003054 [Vaccinium darrowii]
MEPSNFFRWIVLVLLISVLESAIASNTSGNETDRIALLDFKNHITQDPFQIMSSWNDSLHFCNWVGVKCNPTKGRVTILNLESQNLFGSIPPSIGNLTFLTGINLVNNSFHGEIPQEIGRLIRLQHLNLSYNSFSGKIPSNLSQCGELTIIWVTKNELVGQIPEQLGLLSKLVTLAAEINHLSGTIPASIGNLSSLYILSLMQNSLRGHVPEQVGLLSERVRDIVDGSLLLEEEEYVEVDHVNEESKMEERAIISDGDPQSSNARSGIVLDCLVSVLKIGLSCSDSLPGNRIPMNIVAKKMHAIRDSFLKFKRVNRI